MGVQWEILVWPRSVADIHLGRVLPKRAYASAFWFTRLDPSQRALGAIMAAVGSRAWPA